MFIGNDKLDVMLITKVIPTKNQTNQITQALLDIEGYTYTLTLSQKKKT